MTPSIADKTPIPAKVWRRHTDPPSLWIAVFVGSVLLHLLAFSLIRLTGFSRLSQEQDKAAIPIEVVEISSETKPRARKIASKPKSVSPKPASKNQNIQATNSPKQVVRQDKLTAKPAPIGQDRSAIAFAEQRQREQAQQLQREQLQREQLQHEQAQQLQREQLQREQAQQLQREQLQREQAQQLQREQLQREQAQQLQREQLQREQAQQLEREQLQREQAQQLQREQLQREQAQQLQREQAQQLQREQAQQLQREQAQQSNTQESSSQTSNPPVGRLLASLVGQPQQVERERHNHPAKIKPSDQPFSKGLEYVKFIEGKPGQPVEFTAILTISEKGKLEKIAIEDDAVPVDQRSYYEDFVTDEVFQGWEFEPAYDNDPNDPKPSELIVRIKIQPLP